MTELTVYLASKSSLIDISSQLSDGAADLQTSEYGSIQEAVDLVLCSLFTWRRAEEGDRLPDGAGSKNGVWMDSYLSKPGRKFGSRLWLLSREIITEDLVVRARGYVEEALKWLVEDGYFLSFDVRAWRALEEGIYRIRVEVSAVLKNGSRFSYEVPVSEAIEVG